MDKFTYRGCVFVPDDASEVEECPEGQTPHFWGVYEMTFDEQFKHDIRRHHADFYTEADAKAYCDWRNGK